MKTNGLTVFLTIFIIALSLPGLAQAFEARFAGQQTVDGENALAVTFSKPLDGRQNLAPFFSITTKKGDAVDGAWILADDPHTAYFTQVEPETAYEIRVGKGLKARSGESLASEAVYEITTRSAEPMIMFGSRGFILASSLTRGLPVDTLNISRADIDFFRVRPEKTMAFKEAFWSQDRLFYYQTQELNQVADLVYSGRWDLDIKKNLRTQVNVPVSHIKELQTPGIYFAVLRGAGHYEYGYTTTWFTISDLGLHARVYDQSIDFFVQGLETAGPVDGVRIQGVDKKGKTLFDLTSGPSGTASAKGAFQDLVLVAAIKGSHITLLPMDAAGLDLSEFRAATAPFRPVELFVYGPRDIYRPGETVVMDGLLRNQDGGMTPGLPIRARVIQPDGRMIREFTLRPGPQNHYREAFDLPGDAITGKWQVEFSHAGGRLAPYAFVVAEFLPERMKLAIDGEDGSVAFAKEALSMDLQGDFLYDAPAAGARADARVHIKAARELFEERWPGYEFGDIQSLLNTSFAADEIRLDDTGAGRLSIKNQWQEIRSPHWVTANVSLYDAGGRPVVRNRSWQVWPADTLVGIRNLSGTDKDDPALVKNDSIAEFEVMVADSQGNRLGARGLEAVVIREHREYYWEYKNGEWHWGVNSQFYPIDRFSLEVAEGKTARVSLPVEWGGYRLEIRNPATGLTSSYSIWAGWRQEGKEDSGNRPDRVDIALDKPAYRAGDKARVTLKAPEGGRGFLFVDADSNLLTLPVEVPAEGKTFEIFIDPAWARHDIYVSALVVRPGSSRSHDLPKRAVGLVPLVLDRADRMLAVSIDAPEKTEPGRQMTIPVTVADHSGQTSGKAWVTLAAVDIGILNLTGFKTPSPHDYFFQNRSYPVGLKDVYQKLIEANDGGTARQRFGGDAPVLSRGGDRPATDVRILSIQRRAIQADDRGKAVFTLDIPQFDGSIRLMAVAHTEAAFGSGEQEMILASPLMVQAVMPRFLAAGDKGEMAVEIHNLTPDPQNLAILPTASGPVYMDRKDEISMTLNPGEKQVLRLPLTAGATTGRADLSLEIKGLKAVDPDTGKMTDRILTRSWFLETRPPYPALTRIWNKTLAPGESFRIDPEALDGLVPGTVAVRAGLDTEPPINLSEHVSQLLAYPYGCLEQTVSGLFPHVLLTREQFAALGVATGTAEETAAKIDVGIQRLLEKQKSGGGFALWRNSGPESAWLTAYAAHFFVAAHNAGFEVPESAVKKALERLLIYVRQPGRIPYQGYVNKEAYRAAVRAYAAFVLARVQSLSLGDARSVAAYTEKYAGGSLAFVQAGTALYLAGDRHLAVKFFDRAIRTARDSKTYIGDYGSDIRDFAGSYTLLTTYYPDYKHRALFAHELDRALREREWLSTQERNTLVMAGAARAGAAGKPWQAELTVGSRTSPVSGTGPGQAVFTRGIAAQGFQITNQGKTDLHANILLSGYPNQKPMARNHGVDITRRFLSITGDPMDIAEVNSGDRIIVELKITPEKRMPHALAVDMIPAGLELEDPNVAGAFAIDDIMVLKKTIREWQESCAITHTEYRDDRFAAALDIRGRQQCRIYYAARVVSPGRFRVPAPMVEDMYRPYIRSVGRTIDWMTVARP